MKRQRVEKKFIVSLARTSSSVNYEVNHVPLGIVEEILVKLPIKCVLRCKGVCKSWFDLIGTSIFSKKYLKSSPFTWVLLSERYDVKSLYLLEIEAVNLEVMKSRMSLDRVNFILPKDDVESCSEICCRPKIVEEPVVLKLVGSINGLCCYVQGYNNPFNYRNLWKPSICRICNPITGEHMELPRGKFHKELLIVYGFGFSPSTSRYKVVRISGKVGQIFTIGVDKNWRNLEDSCLPITFGCSLVFFNGFLHSLCIFENLIYALNVEEEKDQSFACPTEILSCSPFRLTVLDDHLCVVKNTNNLQIDIWVMKEYGVAESWTKNIIVKDWDSWSIPLILLKDGKFIYCDFSSRDSVALHDQKDEKCCVVSCEFYSRLKYEPCFSSLKDVMMI